MQSKFAIMRNNRHKMAEAKSQPQETHVERILRESMECAADKRRITVDHWPRLDPEYSRPAVVWWNPKTWRF